jgi:hypothetical protein
MGTVIEVKDQNDAVQFRRVLASEVAFSEAWLQDVLRRHPEILPVEEFGPVFHPLVPIGKEMPTTAGSIDNLFISHAGYLVLVETKLWRNPEAKREVMAQLIDYATALSRLTYDDLDKLVQEYLQKHEGITKSLQEWVESRIEPVDIGFQRRVSRSLKFGRLLQLIVTDDARPALVDMLTRVNSHPALSMDIGIVELRPFRRVTAPADGILLVPYVAGRTEIVQRSVVEVSVPGFPEAQVAVRQDNAEADGGRRERIALKSLDAFWELMHDQAPEAEEPARRLIDAFRGDSKFDLGLREASIVVEAGVPGTDVSVSLFFVKSNGVVGFWPGTIRGRLHAGSLSAALADEYVANMRTLWGAAPNKAELYCEVGRINVASLRETVDRFVRRIEEASPCERPGT